MDRFFFFKKFCANDQHFHFFFLINEIYGQIWVLLIFEMTRFKYQLKFITSQLFLFEQNLQINGKLLCTSGVL